MDGWMDGWMDRNENLYKMNLKGKIPENIIG
jgi:hypothetical protein